MKKKNKKVSNFVEAVCSNLADIEAFRSIDGVKSDSTYLLFSKAWTKKEERLFKKLVASYYRRKQK